MNAPFQPAYSYRVALYAGHRILCIKDEFDPATPTISVTNAAAYVLARIRNEVPLPKMIIYRDTDGLWDRLNINDKGQFVGFAPVAPGIQQRPSKLVDALQLLITDQAESSQGVM